VSPSVPEALTRHAGLWAEHVGGAGLELPWFPTVSHGRS
jgi:hypothetical protein